MSSFPESTPSFPYELRVWPIAESLDAEGEVDERAAGWADAVAIGFGSEAVGPDAIRRAAAADAADGQQICGVYPTTAPAGGLPANIPVGTYASYPGTVNVGGGRLLAANLITAVTVRPSHRRRGILSAMIGADLAKAQAAGFALAALTATEAVIYGRFGFGEASTINAVTVDTSPGFALRSAPTGTVDLVPNDSAGELQSRLFESLYRSGFGSVSRPAAYRARVSGAWMHGNPDPDKAVRVAAHFGLDGGIDGYVSYKQIRAEGKPATLQIIDLLALDANAYLGLWEFLAGVDRTVSVSWARPPGEDPLRWALVESMRYSVSGVEDDLWLRLLDVPAALAARKYWADGVVEFEVRDRMELVAGKYRLTVRDGQGEVSRLAPDTELAWSLDTADLAALYLSGTRAGLFLAAGRFGAPSSGLETAVAQFDAVFAVPAAPLNRTEF